MAEVLQFMDKVVLREDKVDHARSSAPPLASRARTQLTRLMSAGWLRRGVHARGPCDQLEVSLRQGEPPHVPGKVSPPGAGPDVPGWVSLASPCGAPMCRAVKPCVPIQWALGFCTGEHCLFALGRSHVMIMSFRPEGDPLL